jgi:hypothetical protein
MMRRRALSAQFSKLPEDLRSKEDMFSYHHQANNDSAFVHHKQSP